MIPPLMNDAPRKKMGGFLGSQAASFLAAVRSRYPLIIRKHGRLICKARFGIAKGHHLMTTTFLKKMFSAFMVCFFKVNFQQGAGFCWKVQLRQMLLLIKLWSGLLHLPIGFPKDFRLGKSKNHGKVRSSDSHDFFPLPNSLVAHLVKSWGCFL